MDVAGDEDRRCSSLIDHFNLAVVVPLVAVVVVCPGKELEESRGLVPGAALAAAWVFGLGS